MTWPAEQKEIGPLEASMALLLSWAEENSHKRSLHHNPAVPWTNQQDFSVLQKLLLDLS